MNIESPIIIFFLIIISVVLIYFILYHLKGGIKFTVDNVDYLPGDKIKGHITVFARRPIKGNRLSIYLEATSKLELRNIEGKTKRVSKKMYEDEVILENEKYYPAGYKEMHSFEIKIPSSQQCDLFRSGIYHTEKMLGGMFGSESKYIDWVLKARLDAKGIDLRNKKYVFVKIEGLDYA